MHVDCWGEPGDAGMWAGRQPRRGLGKGQSQDGQGLRHVGLRFQVRVYERMRAHEFVTSQRCLRFVLAGLCASRVGAAEPVRTDFAPLYGTAFTMGHGWRSASLVTVEDEGPELDTVVVDLQGGLDTNVQVASEIESAGVFTVTIVHIHCAHGRRHRDAIHTCAHRNIHTYARALALCHLGLSDLSELTSVDHCPHHRKFRNHSPISRRTRRINNARMGLV
jgi:hypothetical protein